MFRYYIVLRRKFIDIVINSCLPLTIDDRFRVVYNCCIRRCSMRNSRDIDYVFIPR